MICSSLNLLRFISSVLLSGPDSNQDWRKIRGSRQRALHSPGCNSRRQDIGRYELCEALMLLCFSVSWYWSIARMLKVRAAAGKSSFFVLLICTGYIFGIAAKVALWRQHGELSPLVWLYAWNLAVTAFDLALVLYFTNRLFIPVLRRSA